MTALSLYDEMDAAADQLPAGACFETFQVLFRELRIHRCPDLPQGLWDDTIAVWRLRYDGREVLRQDARRARLEAIALDLVTTPPGEKRDALAAEAAQLYAPQQPEPLASAVWVDG